jgi:hypothetical protein
VSPLTQLSPHRGRFGGHYMARSDEWAFRAEVVVSWDAAPVDMRSMALEEHNPLQRSQRVCDAFSVSSAATLQV